jgi:SAM-dependent methyltransferase
MDDRMKYRKNPEAIDYFDRHIDDFDKIYRADRSWLGNWLDKTIRASIGLRFRLAFELLGDLQGRSVLDVGCGSGRYTLKAVDRGAGKVVGLDAAPGAVRAAQKNAKALGLEDRVDFIEADFIDYEFEDKFDILFAVGYFDYIFDPALHLEKMLQVARGCIYASFPRRWHLLTPVRKLRLALKRYAVRFYSAGQLEKLMRDLGCRDHVIRKVARDYVLLIRK